MGNAVQQVSYPDRDGSANLWASFAVAILREFEAAAVFRKIEVGGPPLLDATDRSY
jgi:hypothetical protein